MSKIDTCPTKKNEPTPDEMASAEGRATGRVFWRSLDELAGSREFKDFLHREFPAHASELLSGSRRQFLKVMSASLALAGASTIPGCRRPDHKIITYNEDPEHVVPGKPLYYATAMPLPGGGAAGVLAETHEGRPTKIEGNPLHPQSKGKSDSMMQSSVLSLYSPDRDPARIAKYIQEDHPDATTGVTPWQDFEEFAASQRRVWDQTGGRGLAFLVEKSTSPSRDRLRAKVVTRWPNARWYVYEPLDNENALEGSRIAFGDTYRQHLSLEEARVVVSLDSDFLGGEDATLASQRGFAAGRYRPGSAPGHSASDSEMSRLYVIESGRTITGGQADHRLPLKPSQVRAFALRLGAEVLGRVGGDAALAAEARRLSSRHPVEGVGEEWIDAVVGDLVAARGASVIAVGPAQPPEVHAIAHAMNAALGAHGAIVRFTRVDGDAAEASSRSISELTREIDRGRVETLVVVGCNPVFDAPGDLGFGETYKRVKNRVRCGEFDETAAASTMFLPRAHYLESWGDVIDWDSTYSVSQPMIAPLFGFRSDLELLATLLDEREREGYAITRRTFAERHGLSIDTPAFEKSWRRTLHDGLRPGSGGSYTTPTLRVREVVSALSGSGAFAGSGVEAVFVPCPKVFDGRFADNGWLQELPHQVTKISWDNPALVSVATAKKLGIPTEQHPKTPQYNHAHVAEVTIGGRSARVPVWVQPGLADDTIVFTCGYGRTVCGRVGEKTGVDVYPLRSTGAMRVSGDATVAVARDAGLYLLANTQDHWAMEGRAPVREIDLPRWRKFGDLNWLEMKEVQVDHYDHSRDLTFAGLLGNESHTPANRSIYTKRQQHHYVEVDEEGEPIRDEQGRVIPKTNRYGRRQQQWGMSIDLTKCTGCGACTVACQAENNIPIVGKMEVAKGREMHWIRVDRYYASTIEPDEWGTEPANDPNPEMVVQPVPCMQCENAPCEVVCPVNATVHSDNGLNDMAYNRCIGTRYCSNNCPYKVRRFNYFDYATKEFKGGYGQLAEALEGKAPLPSNPNFIPPRLREPRSPVSQMVNNPHVTVRSRGVMEKCTYCVQRINQARVETRLEDLDVIPDGFFQTACQQACPSDAIVFGDIYDFGSEDSPASRVSALRNDPRSYQLLAYLNARPRTTYMLRIRNPHPSLVSESRKKEWEVSPAHHGGHDEHHNGHHDDADGDSHAMNRIMGLPILNNAGVPA